VDGLDILTKASAPRHKTSCQLDKEFQVSQSNLDLSTELTSSEQSTSRPSLERIRFTAKVFTITEATGRLRQSAIRLLNSIQAVRRELGGALVKDKLFGFG